MGYADKMHQPVPYNGKLNDAKLEADSPGTPVVEPKPRATFAPEFEPKFRKTPNYKHL
jgi:hypothetical protein